MLNHLNNLLWFKVKLTLWVIALLAVAWVLLVGLLHLFSSQPSVLYRFANMAGIELSMGSFAAITRPLSLSIDFAIQDASLRWEGGELRLDSVEGDIHLANLVWPDLAVGRHLLADGVVLTLQAQGENAEGVNIMKSPWLRLWEDTNVQHAKVIWQAESSWLMDDIQVHVGHDDDWQAGFSGTMHLPGWKPFPVTAVASISHQFGFHPQLAFQAKAKPNNWRLLNHVYDLQVDMQGNWQEDGLNAHFSLDALDVEQDDKPLEHHVLGTIKSENLLAWQAQVQELILHQQKIDLPVWPTFTVHPERGAVLTLNQIHLSADDKWLTAMPLAWQQKWLAWRPVLWLNQMSLHWGSDGALDAIRGGIDLLSWQAHDLVPGLTLKQVQFDLQPKDGRLNIVSAGGSELAWPKSVEAALPVKSSPLVMKVNPDSPLSDWQLSQWQLQVGELNFSVSAEMHPDLPMNVSVVTEAPSLQAVKAALPMTYFSPELQHWLKMALVAGDRPKIKASFHGDLDQLQQGKLTPENLQILASVDQLNLRFDQHYPAIEEADARVTWLGDRIEIRADHAKTHGALLEKVAVDVLYQESDKVALRINGHVKSSVSQVKSYLLSSPLAADIGVTSLLRDSELSGQAIGKLSIWLPLQGYMGASNLPRIRGVAQFEDAAVQYADETLEHLKGDLLFSESGVYAPSLRGTWRRGSVSAGVFSLDKGQVLVKLQGDTPVMIDHVAEGRSQWAGELRILADTSMRLQLTGSASALNVLLPSPFSRRGVKVPWQLSGQGDDQQWRLVWQDDRWQGTLRLQKQLNWQLQGLQLAEKGMRLNESTGPVMLHLPSLVLQEWMDWWQGFNGHDNDKLLFPANGSLLVDRLQVANQKMPSVMLTWQLLDQQSGQLAVSSSKVAGEVSWRPDKVTVHLSRLSWLRKALSAEEKLLEPVSVCAAPSKQAWLPVAIDVDRMTLETLRDGEITTSELTNIKGNLTQQGSTRQLNDFAFQLGSYRGQMAWQWNLLTNQSSLQLKSRADKAEDLMALFGLPSAIRGGSINLQASMQWPGGWDCFDNRLITGQLSVRADDGALSDTSPGLARLFGLLSFDAFTKRLKIGLSDVVNQGLSYDKIEANAQLDMGVLDIKQLTLIGPSVKMSMAGTTDLIAEEHNLSAQVTPLIGDSIPTMALLSGASPITAIGVYLLQKIVPPLSGNLFTFDYRIRGSWQEPIFEDVVQREAN